jgi:hypothetical protein
MRTIVIIAMCYTVIFPSWVLAEMLAFSNSEGNPLRFFFNNFGDLTNHFAIWIGTLTGALIALIFFWINERQKASERRIIEELKKIRGTYSARTYLWNLYDIFNGKADRVQPNKKNRETYVDLLKKFIDDKDNNVKENDEIYQIWKDVQHDEIPNIEHNTRECEECKKISKLQKDHFGEIFQHQHGCEKCANIAERIMTFIKDRKNRNLLEPDKN